MIYIKEALKNGILREGEAAYPNECCGVLFGETGADGGKRLRAIWPIANAREGGEQYHRFLITPEDLMRAELKARQLKLDVLGFYHSHPDCAAVPSDYDREHALPFYSYIITEVRGGAAGEFTSWGLTDDRARFTRETIVEEE
jgi:proteasome lid subunit RPN8/RPN11